MWYHTRKVHRRSQSWEKEDLQRTESPGPSEGVACELGGGLQAREAATGSALVRKWEAEPICPQALSLGDCLGWALKELP